MIVLSDNSTGLSSRLLARREFDEAQALVDHAMRPGATLSMADDFPLLVGKMARSERRVVADTNGRLVAHAAMRRFEVAAPSGERLTLANIGAVCTAPEARGRGYAKTIVRDLLDSARRTGAAGAILWTSLEGFYETLGFSACSGEIRYGIDRHRLPRNAAIEVRRITGTDVQALLHLRGRDPAPVLRTPAEARVLFALPRTRTYVAFERGRASAYVVIGKGLDFVDLAHEWAGDPEIVAALLREALFAEGLESTTVLGPEHDHAFTRTFGALARTIERAPIGWIAPLNRPEIPAMIRGDVAASPLPLYVWGLDSM